MLRGRMEPPPAGIRPISAVQSGPPANAPQPNEAGGPSNRRRSAFLDWFTATGSLISGLATAGALIFAGGSVQTSSDAVKVAREQLRQAEDSQITERFTKAVNQLSSRALTVRLSGIYTLERVASDSERDQPVVIEALCAFVRVKTEELRSGPEKRSPTHPGLDTQAALSVIGRRVIRSQPEVVDLRKAHLVGADLTYARLAKANLGKANLSFSELKKAILTEASLPNAVLVGANLDVAEIERAVLAKADLTDAVLTGAKMANSRFGRARLIRAQLQGAILSNARFPGTDFTDAKLGGATMSDASAPLGKFIRTDLSGAILHNADLSEANFKDAKLVQADLSSADLTDARNITLGQLRSAKGITVETRLPPGFTWTPERGVQKK